MICRHCSQWNADGEQRCCFCGNRLDAEEDTTRSGTPGYLRPPTGTLDVVKPLPGLLDDLPPERGLEPLLAGKEVKLPAWSVAAGVVVLAVIVGLLWRC